MVYFSFAFRRVSQPSALYLNGKIPLGSEYIVLPEDLHPLLMAIKLLEPSLCYLLQEEVLFAVVMDRFRPFGMMLSAKITPEAPLLGKPSVRGSVHEMMFFKILRILDVLLKATKEALFCGLRLNDAHCHLFNSFLMYSMNE